MIQVNRLSKFFEPSGGWLSRRRGVRGVVRKAVDDVSFECRPGRIFCLLGPNGAGKTTTLRMIATMLKPSTGSIIVDGLDAAAHPREVRRRLGILTGATSLYDRLTADETATYYGRLHGLDDKTIARRRDVLYDLFDMHGYASVRVGEMSTGMRQKVSIVRTMIHNPRVVIFDEVTSGLDVIAARSIVDLVHRCRKAGKTVIFSTHRMDEVSMLADDLGVMHNGRLRYAGPFESFAQQRNPRYIEAAFMNLVQTA